jgi:hypothetical protein
MSMCACVRVREREQEYDYITLVLASFLLTGQQDHIALRRGGERNKIITMDTYIVVDQKIYFFKSMQKLPSTIT